MTHKLEHELGGMFDVTHGAGLAAVWSSWARYVCGECLHRFVRYARNVMGITLDGTDEEVAEAGICAMEDFYRSIGMPVTLRELGVEPTEEQILELAEKCSFGNTRTIGIVKKLGREDMAEIYRMAKG